MSDPNGNKRPPPRGDWELPDSQGNNKRARTRDAWNQVLYGNGYTHQSSQNPSLGSVQHVVLNPHMPHNPSQTASSYNPAPSGHPPGAAYGNAGLGDQGLAPWPPPTFNQPPMGSQYGDVTTEYNRTQLPWYPPANTGPVDPGPPPSSYSGVGPSRGPPQPNHQMHGTHGGYNGHLPVPQPPSQQYWQHGSLDAGRGRSHYEPARYGPPQAEMTPPSQLYYIAHNPGPSMTVPAAQNDLYMSTPSAQNNGENWTAVGPMYQPSYSTPGSFSSTAAQNHLPTSAPFAPNNGGYGTAATTSIQPNYSTRRLVPIQPRPATHTSRLPASSSLQNPGITQVASSPAVRPTNTNPGPSSFQAGVGSHSLALSPGSVSPQNSGNPLSAPRSSSSNLSQDQGNQQPSPRNSPSREEQDATRSERGSPSSAGAEGHQRVLNPPPWPPEHLELARVRAAQGIDWDTIIQEIDPKRSVKGLTLALKAKGWAPWTLKRDKAQLELHKEHGDNWAEIRDKVKDAKRSEDEIMNRIQTLKNGYRGKRRKYEPAVFTEEDDEYIRRRLAEGATAKIVHRERFQRFALTRVEKHVADHRMAWRHVDDENLRSVMNAQNGGTPDWDAIAQQLDTPRAANHVELRYNFLKNRKKQRKGAKK